MPPAAGSTATPRPGPARRSARRQFARIVVFGFLALLFIFLEGPRERVTFHERPLALPESLDPYLALQESQFPNLTPGAEKTIVWANADQRRTPVSIVYLHDFTATRQETAPLADELARELGANLFYTRLTGHGLGGAALAEATADDWLNDSLEALAVGRRIGEQVIVIGSSTGGTLATWLALRPEAADVRAFVLLSPNFGPAGRRVRLLTWPWARYLVSVLTADNYTWQPRNPQHARYWTTRYPSRALLPMAALVREVRESPLEQITRPFLVIYSPADTVISARETAAQTARIGGPARQIVVLPQTENPDGHVLAGRILAPNGTAVLRQLISDYLKALPR